MKRRAARVPAAIAASGATIALVSACDAILGIDEYPALTVDAGGQGDATFDATSDANPDGGVSGDDASDGGDGAPSCDHSCVVGATTCLGASSYETCVADDAGCGTPTGTLECPSGSTCWGAPTQAYCCSGGTETCAPSCHNPALNGTEGGNGQTNCGRSGMIACCTSLDVSGGTFYRSYDAVEATDDTNPATVSTFSLDEFEVTVGRFRPFVDAWDASWRPADGAGVHTHLNGGRGLVDSSGDGGTYEPGWSNAAWDALLPATKGEWDDVLDCDGALSTWTPDPGATEVLPINCVTWEEAYAFCIWDGGFLPSEAEWNYAAAGGAEQRVYPWSSPPTSEALGCLYANYDDCGYAPRLVGLGTNGYGKWGQLDLTGNVWEWTFDYFAPYVTPCVDCAFATPSPLATTRTIRGASWNYDSSQLFVATRGDDQDSVRYADDGFRCARTP